MRYLFEDLALDTDCRELRRGADMVPVEPQVFDLLVYLIRNRERVVSRDDLLASVWQGRLVSESALNTRIHLARSAIGDSGEDQRLIKTFPRKGIRFVGLVREDQQVADPVPEQTRAETQLAEVAAPSVLTMMASPTIAVLRFTTLGSQDEPHSVAAGLGAEVRSELARTHRGFDLIIKAAGDDRAPPSSPKVAGSLIAARYVVVGTTWLDRDVQRAHIQLIEAETDRQLWSEPFEFNWGQSGTINRMAARIARLLVIQVRTAESRRPLPTKVEAGHCVLQGRALHETERGPRSTSEAHSLFKKALQLDEDSVVALQGFATTRLVQVHNVWIPWEQRPTALVEASDAIERLVKLDASNAAGHYLRASLLRAHGEPERAIASLQHALSLNPNYYPAHAELGRIKIEAGRAHEAIGHIQEALELNPSEPNIHVPYFWAGMAALHTSDDQVAVQWLLKARQANPAFRPSVLWLAVAYLGVGDEGQARATLAEVLKAAPNFSIASWKRALSTRNPIVAKQRERVVDALRRLGVPEDESVLANQ